MNYIDNYWYFFKHFRSIFLLKKAEITLFEYINSSKNSQIY